MKNIENIKLYILKSIEIKFYVKTYVFFD